jgi:hypothetical protein
MISVLCNVSLWVEHAQEARALSEVISDPEEKQQMLVVAAGFDRIAELAKEQAAVEDHWRLCLKASRHPARMSFFAKKTVRKAALGKHTSHVPALAVSSSNAKSNSNRAHHHRAGR